MNPKPSRRTLNPLSEIHSSVDLKPFITYSRWFPHYYKLISASIIHSCNLRLVSAIRFIYLFWESMNSIFFITEFILVFFFVFTYVDISLGVVVVQVSRNHCSSCLFFEKSCSSCFVHFTLYNAEAIFWKYTIYLWTTKEWLDSIIIVFFLERAASSIEYWWCLWYGVSCKNDCVEKYRRYEYFLFCNRLGV